MYNKILLIIMIMLLTSCDASAFNERYKIICDGEIMVDNLRDTPGYDIKNNTIIWYNRFNSDQVYAIVPIYKTCIVQEFKLNKEEIK